MNNAFLTQNTFVEESPVDPRPILRQRETAIARIIEAINEVASSESYQVLKRELFDGLVETIEREIRRENNQKNIDLPTLYRLQGQYAWAKKYSDFQTLRDAFV